MFGSTQCHYKVVRMQQLPHPPCTAFLFMLQKPHTKLCRPRACNRDFAVSENYATFILNTAHSLPTRPNRSVSIMFQVSHLRPKAAKIIHQVEVALLASLTGFPVFSTHMQGPKK